MAETAFIDHDSQTMSAPFEISAQTRAAESALARAQAHARAHNEKYTLMKSHSWESTPLKNEHDTQIEDQPDRTPQLVNVTTQQWEGYVVEIVDDTVIANLIDLSGSKTIESEQAEISIDEFQEEDIHRLEPGSLFRWIIGVQYQGKTRRFFSQFIVRHLPAWTKNDLDKADQEANEFIGRLRAAREGRASAS